LLNINNKKYFSVKEKFGLAFRKIFFLLAVFVFQKVVSRKPLSKLSYVCLLLEKLIRINSEQVQLRIHDFDPVNHQVGFDS
jgi:hypothetical protein